MGGGIPSCPRPLSALLSSAALYPSLNLDSLRDFKGLTLQEIARATGIAPRYLEAIEQEEFATLPGGIYNTSYIRQYARAVGFSEAALLDRYHSRKVQAPVSLLMPPQSSRPKTRLRQTVEHLLTHVVAKP